MLLDTTFKITVDGNYARTASTRGVEAADPGVEHRWTLDFHGYCIMGACVCCGVSAAVWCVPRLLALLETVFSLCVSIFLEGFFDYTQGNWYFLVGFEKTHRKII